MDQQQEQTWAEAMAYPLACVGAIGGAALGAGLAYVAARAGFYAVIVVGIVTGFGATIAARRGGWVVAGIAVIVALAASFYTEWFLYPFLAGVPADRSCRRCRCRRIYCLSPLNRFFSRPSG